MRRKWQGVHFMAYKGDEYRKEIGMVKTNDLNCFKIHKPGMMYVFYCVEY